MNVNFAQAMIRGENSGLVFAEQWYNFDAFRSQAFHGDVIWGLHVYTAKRMVDRVLALNLGNLTAATPTLVVKT